MPLCPAPVGALSLYVTLKMLGNQSRTGPRHGLVPSPSLTSSLREASVHGALSQDQLLVKRW